MKKIFLFAASALMIQSASAQLSIAPEVGFQMTNVKLKSMGTDVDTKLKPGFRAGVNLDLGITEHLHLQPGLFYSGNGAKQDLLGVKSTMSVNYLQIPVMLNYMTGEAGDNRFFVGIGPYLGYAFSGKWKSGSTKIDLEIGSDEAKDDIKALDFGANVNVGYMLSNGFYARAFYSMGLSNIATGGDSDNSMKNSGFGIALGYNLPL